MLFSKTSNDWWFIRTRRRLAFEALLQRQLLAADIALPDSIQDAGARIVSEFQTPVIMNDLDLSKTPVLGSLIGSIFEQVPLEVSNQSEAVDGILYIFGQDNSYRVASYVSTDLSSRS